MFGHHSASFFAMDLLSLLIRLKDEYLGGMLTNYLKKEVN